MTVVLELHDSGQAHAAVADGRAEWSDTFRPKSATHCMNYTAVAEYEYQLDLYIEEIFGDFQDVVRIECPALARVWERA